MPVPIAIPGGPEYNNFAMLQIEQAVTHLLAHGVPLKTLDYNVLSDWRDSNGHFHTLFHEDLFSKIGRIENCPIGSCGYINSISGQMGFRRIHL